MEREKKCIKCGVSKPLSEYYHHAQMADGFLGKCKGCCRVDSIAHRNANLEKVKQYDKQRGGQPHRLLARRLYSRTASGKAARKIASRNYYTRHEDKRKCHIALSNAVRDGKIKKEPCVKCGDPKSQGHHEDYSRPLEVIWLCDKHHKELHRERNTRN